jgi:putative SOS response-associated peptidase YedK
MCGRFALKVLKAELIDRFDLASCDDYPVRYNIAPGTDIPVIRRSPEGQRVLHLLRWGLIPHWAKDPSIGARPVNARSESVADKPAFRDAFRRRRCLVPADGFYEWKAEGKIKQPYYFSAASGIPLALAGLWESWKAPDGTIVRTVCLLTTQANALMAPVHQRMPVIVGKDDWAAWLADPAEQVVALLRPCAGEDLQAWPVDRRVSRGDEEGAGLSAPTTRA